MSYCLTLFPSITFKQRHLLIQHRDIAFFRVFLSALSIWVPSSGQLLSSTPSLLQ